MIKHNMKFEVVCTDLCNLSHFQYQYFYIMGLAVMANLVKPKIYGKLKKKSAFNIVATLHNITACRSSAKFHKLFIKVND